MTGRHKVPFVPIKTSGTEYVRRYKEKRKRATYKGRGTGRRGMERRRGIGRGSSYDRTDRSGGPGFPLNSQYMIPGNQNEPAFTTSRGGAFPGTTIRSNLRLMLASSEGTTKALVGAPRFNEAEKYCRMYTCIHTCGCATRVRTRDCRNEFATLRNSAVPSQYFHGFR